MNYLVSEGMNGAVLVELSTHWKQKGQATSPQNAPLLWNILNLGIGFVLQDHATFLQCSTWPLEERQDDMDG